MSDSERRSGGAGLKRSSVNSSCLGGKRPEGAASPGGGQIWEQLGSTNRSSSISRLPLRDRVCLVMAIVYVEVF